MIVAGPGWRSRTELDLSTSNLLQQVRNEQHGGESHADEYRESEFGSSERDQQLDSERASPPDAK
jgi:hypothetical protein